MNPYCGNVLLSGIPFMSVKSVMREALVQCQHLGITRGFSQDGSSGDFGYQAIPPDNCGYRTLQARTMISIHQYLAGTNDKFSTARFMASKLA